MENRRYLEDQIVTYLGNKRSLLGLIEKGVVIVKNKLKKDKLVTLDLFSGSGIVARFLKQHSSTIYANDLEMYSKTLNECYLSNKEEVDFERVNYYISYIKRQIENDGLKSGFITDLYSPKNDQKIEKGERVFFTRRNAKYIDTVRTLIETTVEQDYQKFLLGPLLSDVSVHNNTSGVFKGFYKNKNGIGHFGGEGENALNRILGHIELKEPILSNYFSYYKVFNKDANELVDELEEVDLCYIDPPYNQHPYGSNYFMLNIVNNYEYPKIISEVSGIPVNWNRSDYNKEKKAKIALLDVVQRVKAKFVLISFNSEGFISKDELVSCLTALGKLSVIEQNYNTFRGSRNLRNRNIHVKEFLFVLDKRGNT